MADHDLQDYLFDLNGDLILRDVIAPDHLLALNAAFDGFPDLGFREGWGDVQWLDNNARAGMERQNIVHAGKPFEDLIDHPAWPPGCGAIAAWIRPESKGCSSTNVSHRSIGRVGSLRCIAAAMNGRSATNIARLMDVGSVGRSIS